MAHNALFDRVATLSNTRRLRIALNAWKAKLREKKQVQWRHDMRSRMKTVRENHERKLLLDAWTTWRQGHQGHMSDRHFSAKLTARSLTKWRTRLVSLDQLDAAGEHFISIRESMALERSWQVWRHSMHVVKTERTMADRVTLRMLFEAMTVWKKRMYVLSYLVGFGLCSCYIPGISIKSLISSTIGFFSSILCPPGRPHGTGYE